MCARLSVSYLTVREYYLKNVILCHFFISRLHKIVWNIVWWQAHLLLEKFDYCKFVLYRVHKLFRCLLSCL